MSADRLQEAVFQKRNPTVLGLDPQPEHIPPDILAKHTAVKGETLAAMAAAYEEVNFALIDALCDIVPAVKLQSACYEALGQEGIAVFGSTINYARAHGLYVMADAKRGDIGSTSKAYSAAFLGRTKVGGSLLPVFDTDALTVNPYLGSDNLMPFLQDCKDYDKMVFVLCKTSNRSSSEVQDLIVGDTQLYRIIAGQISRQCAHLMGSCGYLSAGIVVGATQPHQMKTLRKEHPELFFLVPGYGAQGGKAEDLAHAFDSRGGGAIVNNSRGICCAWQRVEMPLADAARREATAMRDVLQKVTGI